MAGSPPCPAIGRNVGELPLLLRGGGDASPFAHRPDPPWGLQPTKPSLVHCSTLRNRPFPHGAIEPTLLQLASSICLASRTHFSAISGPPFQISYHRLSSVSFIFDPRSVLCLIIVSSLGLCSPVKMSADVSESKDAAKKRTSSSATGVMNIADLGQSPYKPPLVSVLTGLPFYRAGWRRVEIVTRHTEVELVRSFPGVVTPIPSAGLCR